MAGTLSKELYSDLFAEIQTDLYQKCGATRLTSESIYKFMLIGKEAIPGVYLAFSRSIEVVFGGDNVTVLFETFRFRLYHRQDEILIRNVFPMIASNVNVVDLGTSCEFWMEYFFNLLTQNSRCKPVKFVTSYGPAFDSIMASTVRGLNKKNVKIEMVVKNFKLLQNMKDCKLDEVKMDMAYDKMVESLKTCTCRIQKLDLSLYNLEPGAKKTFLVKNKIVSSSLQKLHLPDFQPHLPLSIFAEIKSVFPKVNEISCDVYVGWTDDPHLLVIHYVDVKNAVESAQQEEIVVNVIFLNPGVEMKRDVIEKVKELHPEFASVIENEEFVWKSVKNCKKQVWIKFKF